MGGGDLSALKTRVAELYKEHSTVVMQIAKSAAGEFALHQKAIASLLPRLQKAQKGEVVEFSEAEKAQLQSAAKAGKKLLGLSGIFPAAIAEQLKTMLVSAKAVGENMPSPEKSENSMEESALLATADISKSPDFFRDQAGNLIVLRDGEPYQASTKVPITNPARIPHNGRLVDCEVWAFMMKQKAFIFSNQGKKLPVEIIVKFIGVAYVEIKPLKNKDEKKVPLGRLDEKLEKEWLDKLHYTANCHGHTIGNGQIVIPTAKALTQIFNDLKEFKPDTTNKNLVIFRNSEGEVEHSAKFDKKKQKYSYDDGELRPKEGTLEDAGKGTNSNGTKYTKYKNPKGVQEIEKRRPQTKGEVKDGIRIMDNEKDINKG